MVEMITERRRHQAKGEGNARGRGGTKWVLIHRARLMACVPELDKGVGAWTVRKRGGGGGEM